MLPEAERAALSQAEHTLRAQVTDQVERTCRGTWVSLGSWRDPDVERWLDVALPAVRAGMATIASAANVRLARVMEVEPAGLINFDGLRGLPLERVYWRPAIQMRWHLGSGGDPFSVALEKSANRVSILVKTDLQLAYTHQCRAIMGAT